MCAVGWIFNRQGHALYLQLSPKLSRFTSSPFSTLRRSSVQRFLLRKESLFESMCRLTGKKVKGRSDRGNLRIIRVVSD